MTHALTRTSPFGEAFIGRCIKCGQGGFSTGGALVECPADNLVSDEQALLESLEPGQARVWAQTGRDHK